MTAGDISSNLQAIKAIEEEADTLIQEARRQKQKKTEDAQREARKLVEKAQHEVGRYEEFVIDKVKLEAEEFRKATLAKGEAQLADLEAQAKMNRTETVDQLIEHLANPVKGKEN